jgi:PAS domain S-box-containing protein
MSDPFILNARRGAHLTEARMAAAIEASNDAFYDVDIEGRHITWSRGMQLAFGHDPEELSKSVDAWQKLIHPDDEARVTASGLAFLPSGAPSWVETFRFRKADGSYAWVRVRSVLVKENGRPLHIVGAMTDVSEAHEREAEMYEVVDDLEEEMAAERFERARADGLLRSARVEVFCEWDMRSGGITFSPSVEGLLGHRAEAIADLVSFMSYCDPLVGPRQFGEMQEAIESGAISYTSPPFAFRRADGQWINIATHGYIVRDEAGTAIRGVGSLFLAEPLDGEVRSVASVTERQRRVLEMVRAGLTNKAIAAALGVSEQAVKAQIRKLMGKFGVANRAALAAVKLS